MLKKVSWQKTVLALPAILFFLLFALGPMVVAIYFGFLEWDGLSKAKFIGFDNWVRMFNDSVAIKSIVLTIEMMIITWIIQTPISMFLGIFLAGRQRYRAIFGLFYFFPLLFSAAAIGLIWLFILDPQFGLANPIFSNLGIDFMVQNWLSNEKLAFITVAVVVSWQFIPFHTLLYQAGVQGIPDSIFDAAEVDGAKGITRFFYIILPQLKHTITTSTVLMLTGALTYFDLIYVMTNGGPAN